LADISGMSKSSRRLPAVFLLGAVIGVVIGARTYNPDDRCRSAMTFAEAATAYANATATPGGGIACP